MSVTSRRMGKTQMMNKLLIDLLFSPYFFSLLLDVLSYGPNDNKYTVKKKCSGLKASKHLPTPMSAMRFRV